METRDNDDIKKLDFLIRSHEKSIGYLSSEMDRSYTMDEIAFFKELRDIKIKERNSKKVSTAVYIENNKGDINIF